MASISSTSGAGSTNSIYGTRNVITGLASGMDTESMIENAISSYKNKIAGLQQKRTKVEWQQEAYRSIIDKMSGFSDKYTSYRSNTNLMSSSFFDQAVTTVSKGENASKVTASGRGTSDVAVNAVKQLATAARYTVSGSHLAGGTGSTGSVTTDKNFNLDEKMLASTVAGTLTLAYGGADARTSLSIEFGELDNFKDGAEMAKFINEKLAEQNITTSSGSSKKASDMLKAVYENGSIAFKEVGNYGNDFYISGTTGALKDTLGAIKGTETRSLEIKDKALTKEITSSEFLGGSDLNITLDGVKKTIKAPTPEELEAYKKDNAGKTSADAFVKLLQDKVDKAFGTLSNGGHKLEVSNALNDKDEHKALQLNFKAQEGSTFQVSSSKGEAMGFKEDVTSYIKTSQKLGDLLDLNDSMAAKDADGNILKDDKGNTLYEFKVNGEVIGNYTKDTSLSTILNNLSSNAKAGVNASYSKTTNEFTFAAKNTGAGATIDFGEKGSLANALFASDQGRMQEGQDAVFEVCINGGKAIEMTRSSNSVDIDGLTLNLKGTFGYETNADGSLKYEQATNEDGYLKFTDSRVLGKKSGDEMKIVNSSGKAYTYTSDGPHKGKEIYGRVDDEGKLSYYVKDGDNGEETQLYLRPGSDNKGIWFSINKGNDAIDVNAEYSKTPNRVSGDPVTFETSADADKIIASVRDMVNDYNAMVTEIKNAYSSLPLQRSNGAYYEPLTDEDKEDMSDSAIESWEKNAKTGILFGDNDLSALYRKLTQAVSMVGQDGADLKAAGITTTYADGLTLLKLDENQLRTTLENDPDKVRDIFTKSAESGAATNGLMQALKAPVDLYSATTGTSAITGTKGVLVNKAGSSLAPSTLYTNTIQKQLNKIDTEIEKWQDKMSDQVDYYTKQFSRLEQLVSQMNSQSSSIMQMMGGY